MQILFVQVRGNTKKKKVNRIKIKNLARWVLPTISALMLLGLAFSSVFLMLRAKHRCASELLMCQLAI